MNSISKENNFNFPRILVRRTILNWRITPESTTHIYRIKGGGGSGRPGRGCDNSYLKLPKIFGEREGGWLED